MLDFKVTESLGFVFAFVIVTPYFRIYILHSILA